MNLREIGVLLDTIAGMDRRTFPPRAEAAWAPVLARVALDDALAAVRNIYASSSGPVVVRPHDVLREARRIAEARVRASAPRALPRRRAEPNPEYRAARELLRLRLSARTPARVGG